MQICLSDISLDVFKHMLWLFDPKSFAAFAITCKDNYLITRKFNLDTIHHIASISRDGCYQIQFISYQEKSLQIKDLLKMTCYHPNDTNKSIQYLLQNPINTNSFTWAKFVSKNYRQYGANETKGYWKLLNTNKDKIITDLNAIKSLVMHKQIAPTLLKYDSHKHNENPFHNKITVSIKNNTYDILFWNGASPNQYNTFQIYDHQKGKNHYYMNFRSDMLDLKWMWYDNDSSLFREYSLGETVKQQIECSFQANLLYNFPMEFQKDNIFNDVNLNALKKELIREYGHQNKLFALRCGFDEIYDINRSIINVQQLTVSINGCYGFSRTIERKHNNKTDFCKYNQNNFNLRMKPLELVDIKEEKSVF
eukprot:417918_1